MLQSTQIGQQGWNQQTPAAVQIIRSAYGAARSLMRRKRSKTRSASSKSATGRKRKRRAASSSKRSGTSRKRSKLVKGSAAAKAYMAKIRAKRK